MITPLKITTPSKVDIDNLLSSLERGLKDLSGHKDFIFKEAVTLTKLIKEAEEDNRTVYKRLLKGEIQISELRDIKGTRKVAKRAKKQLKERFLNLDRRAKYLQGVLENIAPMCQEPIHRKRMRDLAEWFKKLSESIKDQLSTCK